jgi:two-component system, OmpR family, response regulator
VKVLIVDDDPLMRELASFSLSMDPVFDVREADGGADALALIAGGWAPDLVLLDMQMPGMDGAETFARMPSGLRVAVMTAAPEEAEPLLAAGVIGVIPKPIDPASFADRIRSFKAG